MKGAPSSFALIGFLASQEAAGRTHFPEVDLIIRQQQLQRFGLLQRVSPSTQWLLQHIALRLDGDYCSRVGLTFEHRKEALLYLVERVGPQLQNEMELQQHSKRARLSNGQQQQPNMSIGRPALHLLATVLSQEGRGAAGQWRASNWQQLTSCLGEVVRELEAVRSAAQQLADLWREEGEGDMSRSNIKVKHHSSLDNGLKKVWRSETARRQNIYAGVRLMARVGGGPLLDAWAAGQSRSRGSSKVNKKASARQEKRSSIHSLLQPVLREVKAMQQQYQEQQQQQQQQQLEHGAQVLCFIAQSPEVCSALSSYSASVRSSSLGECLSLFIGKQFLSMCQLPQNQ